MFENQAEMVTKFSINELVDFKSKAEPEWLKKWVEFSRSIFGQKSS